MHFSLICMYLDFYLPRSIMMFDNFNKPRSIFDESIEMILQVYSQFKLIIKLETFYTFIKSLILVLIFVRVDA